MPQRTGERDDETNLSKPGDLRRASYSPPVMVAWASVRLVGKRSVRLVGERGLLLRGKDGRLMVFFYPLCGLIDAWARLFSGDGDTMIFAESRVYEPLRAADSVAMAPCPSLLS